MHWPAGEYTWLPSTIIFPGATANGTDLFLNSLDLLSIALTNTSLILRNASKLIKQTLHTVPTMNSALIICVITWRVQLRTWYNAVITMQLSTKWTVY